MAQSSFDDSEQGPGSFPVLVHSHLSWDWVWQRPQQFMVRLARRHPILFVETHAPNPDLSAPRAALRKAEQPNIYILQVQFPEERWSDGEYVDRERRRLVKEYIDDFLPQFRQPVQWFYDPMAVEAFLGHMNEIAVVYDCMDELAKFAFAPPEIGEREQRLLQAADVVFTGGRKLYERKSRFNKNTHFYGCGVDVEHFSQASDESHPVAKDVSQAPSPRFGYIGVIDERLDYGLLDWLAQQRPEWQFLMVGPTTKVDESTLPKHPNIHWVGGRPYEKLPSYAKAFDVCLMPFALNESTEFINPTKALEYMATHRPIVSTPVADVVSNFGEVVHISGDREGFLAACEQAVSNGDDERLERGMKMARSQTWESITEKMETHILNALNRPQSSNGEGYTQTSANAQQMLAGRKG